MLKPKNLNEMLEEIELPEVLSQDTINCRDLIEKCENLNIQEDATLTIKQVSDLLGVSNQTLRNWETSGKLVPHIKTNGHHRRYLESQIKSLRTKQLSIPEIILPDITIEKLRSLGEMLLSSFQPNEKVSLIISQNELDNKVRITIDSEDGLTTVCKTFTVED